MWGAEAFGIWSTALYCMWLEREVLVTLMSRSRMNSSEKAWALLQDQLFRGEPSSVRNVPAGQSTAQGRQGNTGALILIFIFPMPFDLRIFASEWVDLMVKRWTGLTENGQKEYWATWKALQTGTEQREVLPIFLLRSSSLLLKVQNQPGASVWVWEGQLCYHNCCVQICPQLSQQLWHVGPNPADTWNNIVTKNSSVRAVFDTMQKAGCSVSCSLLLRSQLWPDPPPPLVSSLPLWQTLYKFTQQHIQAWSRELWPRTGEASSSRPGKTGEYIQTLLWGEFLALCALELWTTASSLKV